ncbi:hypothetical protein D3C81_2175530 [compost metagenome]
MIGDPTPATLEQGQMLLDQLGSQWAKAIGEVHRMQWLTRPQATWGRSQYSGHIQSQA